MKRSSATAIAWVSLRQSDRQHSAENHAVAVAVNGPPIYTRPGALSRLAANDLRYQASVAERRAQHASDDEATLAAEIGRYRDAL